MLTAKQLNNAVQYALEEEIDYLKNLSSEINEPVIVMIGAGPGILGLAVTEDNPLAFLTVLDIDDNVLNYSRIHLTAAGVSPRNMEFLLGDSAALGKQYEGRDIDILIVDGDHTCKGVLRDIEAWWQHVIPGGYVFFHDFLEREGGFQGHGEWLPGGVAEAITTVEDVTWEKGTFVGISLVYRKARSSIG
jgi:predicted O-methyltransferase YrrM